jgi:hypothetical protein
VRATKAFSSEVDSGSHQENASNKESRACFDSIEAETALCSPDGALHQGAVAGIFTLRRIVARIQWKKTPRCNKHLRHIR